MSAGAELVARIFMRLSLRSLLTMTRHYHSKAGLYLGEAVDAGRSIEFGSFRVQAGVFRRGSPGNLCPSVGLSPSVAKQVVEATYSVYPACGSGIQGVTHGLLEGSQRYRGVHTGAYQKVVCRREDLLY